MDLVAQRYLVTVSGNDGETNSILGCPFSNICNKTGEYFICSKQNKI